ncbi:MAG: Nif3-like dinuclear metal center hexameric protein [Bacteroidetes bacterium]|nr:Nif3-like dinuclear metal center hexameric protein [Bacteroidota bacterium]
MIKLKEILAAINSDIPFALQEEYDNSGLIIGNPDNVVSKGLICVDITEDLIKEAINEKCNVIISHHPIIFKGLKSITGKNYVENVIIEAIKNDIAIISAHTNVDNYYYGVNRKLGEAIGLKNLRILAPKNEILKKLVVFCPKDHAEKVRDAIFNAGAGRIGNYDCCSYNIDGKGSFRAVEGANPFVGEVNKLHFEEEVRIETIFPDYIKHEIIKAMLKAHPYEEVAYDIYPLDNTFDRVGAGMIGVFEKPLNPKNFLDIVKEKLNIPVLKHSRIFAENISSVAICGGSGSVLLNHAVSQNADAFITADIKYNMFFEAENKLLLVDAGHFETEQFTSEVLYDVVSKKITNFALQISKKQYNSVHYY